MKKSLDRMFSFIARGWRNLVGDWEPLVERPVQDSGHCQTNLSRPAKGAGLRRSGCKLTPLNQGGRAVLFEDSAGVEMAVVVEVVVD